MKEIGQVISTENGMARVRFERSSACKDCGACMMSQSQKEMILNTENTLHASVGDWVQVDIESPALIKASLISYIFPLSMLIVGLVLGYFINQAVHIFNNSEIAASILGLLFVVAAYYSIRLLEPKFRKNKGFVPKMVVMVDAPEEKIKSCEKTQTIEKESMEE
ncbi:MAG: SoxR reducing system RseC family protein [Bacillota bacterium]